MTGPLDVPLRVGLLECDHVSSRYRHLAGDYSDMFEALLAPVAPGFTFVRYDACEGKLPGAVGECDAYLAGGSRRSVYDDLGWIHELAGFVRALRHAGIPYVGVCFGHQMLASALGGGVERAASGWGVGVHRMEVAAPEPWMQPAAPACHLQYMHQDQVVAPPPDATVLGSSEHCPVAMLGVGTTMLGIQAHPEFGAPYVDALLAERTERIGTERVEAARRSFATPTDEGTVARWIAGFLAGAAGWDGGTP